MLLEEGNLGGLWDKEALQMALIQAQAENERLRCQNAAQEQAYKRELLEILERQERKKETSPSGVQTASTAAVYIGDDGSDYEEEYFPTHLLQEQSSDQCEAVEYGVMMAAGTDLRQLEGDRPEQCERCDLRESAQDELRAHVKQLERELQEERSKTSSLEAQLECMAAKQTAHAESQADQCSSESADSEKLRMLLPTILEGKASAQRLEEMRLHLEEQQKRFSHLRKEIEALVASRDADRAQLASTKELLEAEREQNAQLKAKLCQVRPQLRHSRGSDGGARGRCQPYSPTAREMPGIRRALRAFPEL